MSESVNSTEKGITTVQEWVSAGVRSDSLAEERWHQKEADSYKDKLLNIHLFIHFQSGHIMD